VWLHRESRRPPRPALGGSLFPQTLEAAQKLRSEGLEADLYNLRFLKPVDEDYLAGIMNSYDLVAFIEEGICSGGFGEYAAALARLRDCRAGIEILAVPGDFSDGGRALGTREELLKVNGLDGTGIAEKIRGRLGK
jgi:1-deoxy-D-xylulose-5-phosphate synthase